MQGFIDRVLILDHWSLLGRWPIVISSLLLFWWASKRFGRRTSALAMAGFFVGVSVGVAFIPSVIGACLGGCALWTITLRLQGERRTSAVPLTLWLLGVVTLGRFGCFIAGCCFGAPTNLPWAYAYGPNTFAAHTHSIMSWTAGAHTHSLGVHPVQLYEAAFLAVLAGLTLTLRKRVKSSLGLALAVGGAYLVFRAAVDPLRGMLNTWQSLELMGALSVFQWAALGLGLALIGAAVTLEWSARSRAVTDLTQAPSVAFVNAPQLWLGLTLLALTTHEALPPLFHGLLVLSLTGAAVCVLLTSRNHVAMALRARSLGGTLAACLLLVPLWSYSDAPTGSVDSEKKTSRRWNYAVDQSTGRLVRIGHQDTPTKDINRRFLHLAGGPGSLSLPRSPTPTTASGYQRRTGVFGALGYGAGPLVSEYSVLSGGSGCSGDSYVLVAVAGGQTRGFSAQGGLVFEGKGASQHLLKAELKLTLWGEYGSAIYEGAALKSDNAGATFNDAYLAKFSDKIPFDHTMVGGALGITYDMNWRFGGLGLGAISGIARTSEQRATDQEARNKVFFLPNLRGFVGYRWVFVEAGLNPRWLRPYPGLPSNTFHLGAHLAVGDLKLHGGLAMTEFDSDIWRTEPSLLALMRPSVGADYEIYTQLPARPYVKATWSGFNQWQITGIYNGFSGQISLQRWF